MTHARLTLVRADLCLKAIGLALIGIAAPAWAEWLGHMVVGFVLHLQSAASAGGDFGYIGRALNALRNLLVSALTPEALATYTSSYAVSAATLFVGCLLTAGRPRALRQAVLFRLLGTDDGPALV